MVAQGQNRLPSSQLLAAQNATRLFKAQLLLVGKNAAYWRLLAATAEAWLAALGLLLGLLFARRNAALAAATCEGDEATAPVARGDGRCCWSRKKKQRTAERKKEQREKGEEGEGK